MLFEILKSKIGLKITNYICDNFFFDLRVFFNSHQKTYGFNKGLAGPYSNK